MIIRKSIILAIIMLCGLSSFRDYAQPNFSDSLNRTNDFLSLLHWNFGYKYIVIPPDIYVVNITNYAHDKVSDLPLQNAEKPLDIPTDDSSRQCVHPSVIDFLNDYQLPEWGGYRYWMAMTPYPYTNAKKENPNIVASHNGINWEVPKGIVNPLVRIENDSSNGNLSDPEIIFNEDSNQIWLYYLHRSPEKNVGGIICLIKINTNMSHSAVLELICFPANDSLTFLSPCIFRESANKWHMWAVRLKNPNHIVYLSSNDGMKWSEQKFCFNHEGKNPINQLNYRPWHISCKPNFKEKRVEFMINCAKGLSEILSPYTTNCLFYAEVEMDNPKLIKVPIHVPILQRPAVNDAWDSPIIYRSSFSIYDNGRNYFYRIWYSAASYYYGTWNIGYTEGLIGSYYSNLKISTNETSSNILMIDSKYKTIRIYYQNSMDDTVDLKIYDNKKKLICNRVITKHITDQDIDYLPAGEYYAIISFRKYEIIKILDIKKNLGI